jgi:hypothetical protein
MGEALAALARSEWGDGWHERLLDALAALPSHSALSAVCRGRTHVPHDGLAETIPRYGAVWNSLDIGNEPSPGCVIGPSDIASAVIRTLTRAQLCIVGLRIDTAHAEARTCLLDPSASTLFVCAALEVGGAPAVPRGIPLLAYALTVPLGNLDPSCSEERTAGETLGVEVLERNVHLMPLIERARDALRDARLAAMNAICEFLGVPCDGVWEAILMEGFLSSASNARGVLRHQPAPTLLPPHASACTTVVQGVGRPSVRIHWTDAPRLDVRDSEVQLCAPVSMEGTVALADDGVHVEGDLSTLWSSMCRPLHLQQAKATRRGGTVRTLTCDQHEDAGVDIVTCVSSRALSRGIPLPEMDSAYLVACMPLWDNGSHSVMPVHDRGEHLWARVPEGVSVSCACAMVAAAGTLAVTRGCPLVITRPNDRAIARGVERAGARPFGCMQLLGAA